ncbi:hypothetical protein QQS21_012122 [Conoideocrella luteorostrata]|uniref:C2H2-type domain-containing protein n=1 Tax=Conoideocrella luteorostrata TaxID=1105319 RepID=A0AAJ0CE46_9HYPO|nr:hypothetical protein QQS21_012122 [Conoideocrella luteorostrata]
MSSSAPMPSIPPAQRAPISLIRREAHITDTSRASPPRTPRVSVVRTNSPTHQTSAVRSQIQVQTTIPHMWELSKHAKHNTSIAVPPARAVSPKAGSESTPVPVSVSAPTPASRGRGRPKGWKPGMPYATRRGNGSSNWTKSPRQIRQARVNAPPLVWKRRPGRPKAASPTPKELYHRANPEFIAFLCEWRGCKAELHNLDTLRKHVNVVHIHGKEHCQWAQCHAERLQGTQDWQSHLEEAHFIPLRWHVGDGPRNTSGTAPELPGESRDAIPDFLMGPDGRQITPSIKDQQLEDFATWRENRRKLKKLLIQRDENMPTESESSESSGDL